MRLEKYSSDCYHIILSEGRRRLTLKEAEDMFVYLLTTLPNVPERIKTLWELRCHVSCEVKMKYDFDSISGTILTSYIGIIKQGDEIIYTGHEHHDIDSAIQGAYMGYGSLVPTGAMHPVIVKEDLVSKKQAEEKAVLHAATKYCEENGITLKQLFAQATAK